ncbi:hypothetical protein OPIT5_29280 [Opitutaceae bacterium TAV5]|nr:hypothetical protein OPIT5_21840 [Opitutaceae bacterium TAV5]AHF93679.1 hypothetical protein OPIT5_29280 [Opitutaceae bacterium TAV5]
MPLNPETLHHTTADLVGTVQLLFSAGATTRAQALARGYLDMGCFNGAEFKAEVAKTEVIKSYRGRSFLARNIPGIMKHGYDLATNEFSDARKIRFALLGEDTDPFTQLALPATEVDPLVFSVQAPAIHNLWYPVTRTTGGVTRQIREIEALTFPDLVEGVDFIVDPKLGLVRFINAAALPVAEIAPTVTAPAITGADHPLGLKAVKPLTRGSYSGYARFLIWDGNEQQPLVMDHQDFSCELSLSGPPTISRDSLSELKILVTITHDQGLVYYRD